MNVEDLSVYKDNRVRLTCQLKNGTVFYYTGSIVELKQNSVVFLDKFKNVVTLDAELIVKAETFSEEHEEQLVDKKNGNSDSVE
jgi:hypothetical protein